MSATFEEYFSEGLLDPIKKLYRYVVGGSVANPILDKWLEDKGFNTAVSELNIQSNQWGKGYPTTRKDQENKRYVVDFLNTNAKTEEEIKLAKGVLSAFGLTRMVPGNELPPDKRRAVTKASEEKEMLTRGDRVVHNTKRSPSGLQNTLSRIKRKVGNLLPSGGDAFGAGGGGDSFGGGGGGGGSFGGGSSGGGESGSSY